MPCLNRNNPLLSIFDPSEMLVRVSVAPLLQQIASLSRSRYAAADIELLLELPSAQAWVMARPGDIGQILLNLLNNAFDAVEDRSQRWVRLTLELGEAEAIVRVIDSGPGVPASIQDKLMTPFCTTKALGRGTGLGLSLSKSLAENLGGRLTHVSPAKHTTFELRLQRSCDDGAQP